MRRGSVGAGIKSTASPIQTMLEHDGHRPTEPLPRAHQLLFFPSDQSGTASKKSDLNP